MSKALLVLGIDAVKRQFLSHSLPWNSEIDLKLTTIGVRCVEELKELHPKEWDGLFADQTVISQRKAKRVFGKLLEEG